MIPHPPAVRQRGLLALSLVAWPFAVWAQGSPETPPLDWKRANEAVAEFPRGHADVLKWEQAHPTTPPQPVVGPAKTAVTTAEDAVRLAWQVHRELVDVQSRLGPQLVQAVAGGHWLDLDPALQRRVEGMDELLAVAVQARKAWINAVAARQMVRHQQASLDAAQAANDLGKRMVAVGNWSRLQQSPVQLAETAARMDWRRAKLAAAQAEASLLKLLGPMGIETGLALPDPLPDLPDVPGVALAEPALEKAAKALQAHLARAEKTRNQALWRSAFDVYQTAHALALDSRDGVLKERTHITDETVLHYNGMLKSVWELLTETRNQARAAADAVGTQRDFWLAHTDLQWVLQGGEPDRFVSLGGAADAPQAAAH